MCAIDQEDWFAIFLNQTLFACVCVQVVSFWAWMGQGAVLRRMDLLLKFEQF